jgi:Raf kinase inhibitor-like YbhB/YbcL family protein
MRKIVLAAVFLFFVVSTCTIQAEEAGMKLSSPAFKNNSRMPSRFTCEGQDISPELIIEGIPEGTKSLALIVDDPDAPMKTWVHWVVYDMAPLGRIAENSVPGKQGINDFRRNSWGGPCPPSGEHRYYFKLYALDKVLGLGEGADKKALEKAMEGHILGKAELVGLYKRGEK